MNTPLARLASPTAAVGSRLMHCMPCIVAGLFLGPSFSGQSRAVAAPPPTAAPEQQGPVRFQDELRPLLAVNCLACHNSKTREGGLSLETVATIVAGGDSGPGVVPGKPAESVLLVRAAHRDADADTMPPQGNSVGARSLSTKELELLERWIAEGAAAGSAATARAIDWRPLAAGTGAVVCVDMTVDGRLTAAARGSRVSLFDTIAGTPQGDLIDGAARDDGSVSSQAHRDPIGALAFSPDGNTIATGSFRTIKLWKRMAPRIAVLADTAAATATAVSPDGAHIAFGMPDGKVAVVEVKSGKPIRVQTIHEAPIASIAFAPDGATLFSLAASGNVAATTVTDGVTTGRLARPAGTTTLAVLDTGRIVTAEPDGVLRVWALPLPVPPPPEVTASTNSVPISVPMKELIGPQQPIAALCVVPTMPGHLVAGGGDGKARLWDANAGAVVREVDHGGSIAALAVRPDGSRLATAGTVPGMKLWSLADGKLVAATQGDVRLMRRAAAADLRIAVDKQDVESGKARVAAAEKAIKDAADEKQKAIAAVAAAEKLLGEKTAAVDAAEKGNNEAKAAVGAAQAEVASATEAHAAAVLAQAAATAAAAAAAESLAAFTKAGGASPAADALNATKAAATAATTAKSAAEAAVVQAAAQIERGKAMIPEAEKKVTAAAAVVAKAQDERTRADKALVSAKQAVEFVAMREGQTQGELPKRQTELHTLEGQLAADTAARGALEKDVKASARPLTALAFSRDGQWLAGSGLDGFLSIAGGTDGGLRDTYEAARPAGAGPPVMLSWSDGRLLVAGAGSPAATWDVREAWTLERTIGGESTPAANDDDPGGPPIGTVMSLAFSPDGRLLASGSGRASRNGEIKLWNMENGMLFRALPQPHADTVMTLAFSSRGDLLASGATDRFVKVHTVGDGNLIRSFEGHAGHVLALSWQANGQRLASAGADQSIRIWDMATGGLQRTITGPKKELTGARFLGVSDELVASAADPLVRIYNVGNGSVVREFGGASDFVHALATAANVVAAGGQDGKVRLWNIADPKLIHTLDPSPARP